MDKVVEIQNEWRRERPDIDPSPQGVIGRLHRIANALHARIDEVYAQFDLTNAEFDILATLRRAGEPYGRPAGELADHTMVTTGGLSKRVDRLEARGLVHRQTEASDARRRVVCLTPEGKELIDRAFTAHMANEHRLLADFGLENAAELEPLLARWTSILEDA